MYTWSLFCYIFQLRPALVGLYNYILGLYESPSLHVGLQRPCGSRGATRYLFSRTGPLSWSSPYSRSSWSASSGSCSCSHALIACFVGLSGLESATTRRPEGIFSKEGVFSCVSTDRSRFRFVQHRKVVILRNKHQSIPGRTSSRPKPMNPTPMIVAEFFVPRLNVTATGMDPTATNPTPSPITISGPR